MKPPPSQRRPIAPIPPPQNSAELVGDIIGHLIVRWVKRYRSVRSHVRLVAAKVMATESESDS